MIEATNTKHGGALLRRLLRREYGTPLELFFDISLFHFVLESLLPPLHPGLPEHEGLVRLSPHYAIL